MSKFTDRLLALIGRKRIVVPIGVRLTIIR